MTETATSHSIHELTESECWTLLGKTGLGRVAVAIDRGVDIFPVNYAVTDLRIYFSSAPGSKLVDITARPQLAFEVDGTAGRERWSGVAKGVGERLSFDTEIEDSGVRELHSLAPSDKWNYIRITPESLTGRRFTARRRRRTTTEK